MSHCHDSFTMEWTSCDDSCENETITRNYVLPSHKWIYETPTKQRIRVPDKPSSGIILRPFVYETEGGGYLYQLHNAIHKYVDASTLIDHKVPIIPAYMQPLNSKNENEQSDYVWKLEPSPQRTDAMNPFMMCTQRPKKKKQYARLFPITSTDEETDEQFNASFTALNSDFCENCGPEPPIEGSKPETRLC